jgi:hypothetical protein
VTKFHPRILLSMISRNWKWSLSISCLLVAAYDTFIDELTIIAATFLGLAALPWIINLFDKITLPGGVEIDFKKVQEVLDAQKVEAPKSGPDSLSFITDDPNLALVALRIEIEKKLRSLEMRTSGKRTARPQNLYVVMDYLVMDGQLNSEVAGAIRDMLPAMNRAAHGEDVPESALSWVRSEGPRLLAALEGKAG